MSRIYAPVPQNRMVRFAPSFAVARALHVKPLDIGWGQFSIAEGSMGVAPNQPLTTLYHLLRRTDVSNCMQIQTLTTHTPLIKGVGQKTL